MARPQPWWRPVHRTRAQEGWAPATARPDSQPASGGPRRERELAGRSPRVSSTGSDEGVCMTFPGLDHEAQVHPTSPSLCGKSCGQTRRLHPGFMACPKPTGEMEGHGCLVTRAGFIWYEAVATEGPLTKCRLRGSWNSGALDRGRYCFWRDGGTAHSVICCAWTRNGFQQRNAEKRVVGFLLECYPPPQPFLLWFPL